MKLLILLCPNLLGPGKKFPLKLLGPGNKILARNPPLLVS